MAAKNMEFDILLFFLYFFDNVFFFFYPKSFVLCSKIVLRLDYMGFAAICIIMLGYYRIHGNKCRLCL